MTTDPAGPRPGPLATLAALAPKAVPGLATTTILILGRIWNAHGAAHSTGDAVLMTALALGTAAAGTATATGRHGDRVLAGAAFTASGTLALAGVTAYADGLPLPVLLWAITTTHAYGLTARRWRTERRETTAHERATTERRETHAHAERVETIRAHAAIETARAGSEYATALTAALAARAALPGYDPTAIDRAGLPALPALTTDRKES
jgi:hypothetical protein